MKIIVKSVKRENIRIKFSYTVLKRTQTKELIYLILH